jgi:hypothetical protein
MDEMTHPVYCTIGRDDKGKYTYFFQTTTKTPYVAGWFRRLVDNETGIASWMYVASRFDAQPGYDRVCAMEPRQ